MDIFEHIMKEHREVEGMLERLSEGYDEKVFNELKLSLAAHMRAEEGSLYPAMKGKEEGMVEHAMEEHRQVDKLLESLSALSKEGDAFTDAIEELTSVINDHVMDEEEQMIPRARKLFDEGEIREMSSRFDEVDESITQKAN
ncbi:MAG: hemerythrin domain-containing protein [Methanomassiliicoccus sp.]|nr:hemerythrin domain-containing protein [Methanomassiliicoccus sp.]